MKKPRSERTPWPEKTDGVSPKDLAEELGIGEKRVRELLRQEHGENLPNPNTFTWYADPPLAQRVRLRVRNGKKGGKNA